MIILTTENAPSAKYIASIAHPEWGNKRFNYNAQPLCNGASASTFGTGSSSAVLFSEEYKFWQVIV